MKAGFANVPKMGEADVILSFRTYLVPPKTGKIWLEVFEIVWLNRYGFEQTYSWSEER
jgi:hypothetical protein